MSGNDGSTSYWQSLAESYWAVGAPLRPPREDIGFMEAAIERFPGPRTVRPLQAILLGVTPAIAQMRWPPNTFLTAVDNSLDMVRGVWPGNVAGCRVAVCANWLDLPLRPQSYDIVIGDGAMNCVRFPSDFRELSRSIHRVLCEEGVFILRAYTRPTPGEQPDEVFADLSRGAISSFHHFKFRLLMAMQETTEQGVVVDSVYRMWADCHIDVARMCERDGWDRDAVRTIELYRARDTVHTFPTLAELRSVLCDCFEEVSISAPSYDLSERCPVLVLRRRRK